MKYTKIAQQQHPELGERAYLDFNSSAGQEYWDTMNLMLDYAKANHDVIHENVLRLAGLEASAVIQNHHNFASVENGLIVHRKGATPAQAGVLGVIPGSLATNSYMVKERATLSLWSLVLTEPGGACREVKLSEN
jgi:tRNA-splicing ligase RtcB